MGVSCCLDDSIRNDGCFLVYISEGYLLLIQCWIINILHSNGFEYNMDSHFLLEKNDNFSTCRYYCTLVYNFSNDSSFCLVDWSRSLSLPNLSLYLRSHFLAKADFT